MSGKTQLKVTFAKKQDGNTSVIVNNNWNWTYFVVFLVSLKWFINGKIAMGIFAILVLSILLKVFGKMIFGKHQRTIEERISSRISNIS